MNWKTFLLIASGLLIFGAMMRLVPHLPNATPITAIAFASSIYLGRRWSLVLPLCAMFLSDMVIGFYDWRIMASVYGSFALIGALSWFTKKYKDILPIGFGIIGASLLFFFVTNFAVWLFSPWYEKNIAGLLYSYELGIPFLRNMLVGDIFYAMLILGVFESARAITKIKNPVPRARGICALARDLGCSLLQKSRLRRHKSPLACSSPPQAAGYSRTICK